MTIRELYEKGKECLERAVVDTPAFDAFILWQSLYKGGRALLVTHGNRICSAQEEAAFEKMIVRRSEGEPLQYILGEWDFLNLTLRVGPGVLIPRPETELLCETAVSYLRRKKAPVVLDLCAGTGAVGIGICSLLPEAGAVCAELYDVPYNCLCENISRYPQYLVRPIRADVLKGTPALTEFFDGIVSNPPYIRTDQLPILQREVRREPQEALDGGEDGLDFYRAIFRHWLKYIRRDGFLAVEIGEEQGENVKCMMEEANLVQIRVLKDFAGLDRVVCGTVK